MAFTDVVSSLRMNGPSIGKAGLGVNSEQESLKAGIREIASSSCTK
jgi:hypothetical protein